MNKLLWKELSDEQRQDVENQYLAIKKQIRSYANIKSNREKVKKYTDSEVQAYQIGLKDLQKQYDNFNIYYICPNCNKEFKLDITKLKLLFKNNNKMLFCCNSCAAKYVGRQYRENETMEQKLAKNEKISRTLKQKDLELSEQELQERTARLTNYWKNFTSEQRSVINKKSVIKSKQTKLERYGNENYNNSSQARETYKKRYSKTPAHNICHLTSETLEIIRDRELFKQFILNIPLDERCIYTIAKNLGISRSHCSTLLNKYNLYGEFEIHRNLSQPQIELQDFIRDLINDDIIVNDRKTITPYELDIYIPTKHLAIEYNGNYYHNTNAVDKLLHYNKSKMCEEKGVRLIHIFEYEWDEPRQRPILENIIKNALGVNEHKLYARQLDIEVRPSKDMREFFDKNNIQGFRGGKFAICLVDKQTRQVYMSYMMGNAFFGKGKYEWEVIRGATELGYTIIGGASKIWKYFIETYNPKSCVYYIDYNYFNGNSLKNLPNMEYVKTQYSYKNYWLKEQVVKNREPARHKEIKELEQQGLVFPIYNAGTKVYVWKANNNKILLEDNEKGNK